MPKGPRAAKGFVFVTADAYGQAAAGDRKLIRSHVMRGKNTRTRALPGGVKGRSPAAAVGIQRPQHATGDNDSPEELRGARARSELLDSDEDALARIRHAEMVPGAADMFTFITFPEDIDSSSRSLLCAYFSYMKDEMYPIVRYSRPDTPKTYWFHWAHLDLAYLHCILYMTSFSLDSLRGQKSRRTEFHAYRMIRELNEQLSDPKTALTDSTTIVVMALALIAESFGDVQSAHMHMMGLKKIIDLRGGIESFASHPLLQSKLHRTGLVHSICTGANLAFHQDAASFDSAFDGSSELARLKRSDASCFSRSRSVAWTLDRRLYAILKDVQGLSQLITDSHDSGHKIREMSLENLITYIQSRLLMLEYEHNDIFPELLRLSLLAFLTTIFWGFPGVKFEYPRLADQFRQACMAFTPSTAGESYLFAWALMVGATSVSRGPDQTWLLQRLRPLIRDSLGRTWFEVKNHLRQAMWIDRIHDRPGIEVFNQCVGETWDRSIVPI
ncbi:hypothetical protein ASPVEDRAFT_45322 [Aspergillus versicolor CBS 583.65]|uniref:Transcription factor domain-containing protein n=1 Tax=Aspergillus versicolor CBS 583.65 TaxID=1036611 RepID=A0A1L9PWE6_ASPVE|nr:uncharacterized protein ASPVEDRAFT_45322 [Aspergillus versicolor CBS 583.65]OJJ05859.1 hypothetical protein ASPVEDRAFT_45322 [Aspergillus versicolor CBS 583.65]